MKIVPARKFALLFLSLLFAIFRPGLAWAQTGPPEGPVVGTSTITATVADNSPPTTPILISPENNSYVTTNYVTFVWKRSTDDNGILKYILWLDGTEYFTDIPPNDAETSQYISDYDGSTEYFTLTVKNPIPDGNHTWKIQAVDGLNNSSNSATWSFTIDTQAPAFVLTQVGNVSTSISAQDLGTIPSEPIVLYENQPQLLGNGEANSDVELVVVIPGDPSQTYLNTTDVNGNWGEILGILPREVVITLNFTITDQAGLVSVLGGVQIIIKQKVITFPPTSPSPSVIPGATPPTTPPTTPSSPGPSPLISIPLTPPVEIAHEIFQEAWEKLPTPLRNVVAKLPLATQKYLVKTAINISDYLLLIFLGLAIVWLLLTLLRRYRFKLSPFLTWRALQALGIAPSGRPQGLVFHSQSHWGAPFIDIELQDKEGDVLDHVITNREGIYGNLRLQPGELQLNLEDNDFQFPTSHARPANLSAQEFYLGETFEITQDEADDRQLFLIPVDGSELLQNRGGLLSLEQYDWFQRKLSFPLWGIDLIITLLFPSVWNILIMTIYSLALIPRVTKAIKRPNLTAKIIDDNSAPLSKAILQLINVNQQLAGLTQSDERGEISLYSQEQTELQTTFTKPGYESSSADQTIQLPQHLVVALKKTSN